MVSVVVEGTIVQAAVVPALKELQSFNRQKPRVGHLYLILKQSLCQAFSTTAMGCIK
jgi:hypothetical protein